MKPISSLLFVGIDIQNSYLKAERDIRGKPFRENPKAMLRDYADIWYTNSRFGGKALL